MQIQSLSIVVPNKQCINHCASCPSRMHDNDYQFLFDPSEPDFDIYLADYLKRLEYARDNGCNTVMLTGTSEPQQNRNFLTLFGMMMKMMKNPFRSIEMQCTGVLLDKDYLRFLHRHVGLTMLALSVFSLNQEQNAAIVNPPNMKNICLDPHDVACMAHQEGLSVRLCLNLTKYFDDFADNPEALFRNMKGAWRADQLTLRCLYAGEDDCPENEWVRKNAARPKTVESLKQYIRQNGTPLGRLPYGAVKYAVNGMSVVLDDDSMGKAPDIPDSYKYLILRPDCRLYSSWDEPGSLVL